MVKYFLEMSGFRVAEATDGENAVRLAEQSHPDLVLIDVSLPLLDGIAVTRHFRQSVSLPNLPVIFISAHAELRLRNEALAAGGNDYLVKPLDLKLLESAVEKHICRESGYGLFTEIL
jgi:DNA-binding response OmpR family regulator